MRKYFNYFLAKLLMKQGNFKEAALILNKLLEGKETDVDYEKLFIARVYIAEAQCAAEQKDKSKQDDFLYKAYLLYPQLLPYTGMAANLSLNCSGNVDAKIVDALKEYNINWVQGSAVPAANVNLSFSSTAKGKNLKYSVTDRNGKEIVSSQSINYTHTEEVIKTLAYRLFNIGTKTDRAEAAPSAKAGKH